MNDYVAYHSARIYGPYSAKRRLNFDSDKDPDYLQKSFGGFVWVIVGTPINGRTKFYLAGRYTPNEIRPRKNGGYNILGSGKPCKPPVELTNLRWFSRLLKEQGRFSFGFNLIKNKVAVAKLHELFEQSNHPVQAAKLTTDDFVKAFETVENKISKLQQRMLFAHFNAPGRKLTARQLAAAVGLPNFNAANLHYGKLGRLLCSVLGKEPEADSVFTLASLIPPGASGNKEWLWVMRPHVAKALEQLGLVPQEVFNIDPELAAIEGAERITLVRHRKREQSLRDAKVAEAKNSKNGRLKCEVPGCGFDFEAVYGELGRDYAQVHHLKPLRDRTTPSETKLNDLAVVCANCHAMIHRGGKCRPLGGLVQTKP